MKRTQQLPTGASAEDNEPYVLAVTACPTGIAHTYMARDALKKQAEKWCQNQSRNKRFKWD